MIITTAFALALFVGSSFSQAHARSITVTPNPGCGNCTDTDLRLLQIVSTDVSDRIIYLLSSFGPPTLLTAHVNSSTNVSVDWACLKHGLPSCVKFSNHPNFVSTFVINRLIEYDDESDGADVSAFGQNFASVRSTYLTSVAWHRINASRYDRPRWNFFLNESNDHNDLISKNASEAFFAINFEFFTEKARTTDMPAILHADSAGMFDIRMSTLATHFNKSRFALEIVIVGDSLPGTSNVEVDSSLDDEYSPGVFQSVTWNLNSDATDGEPSTYIHYKPVSYTKVERNLESIQPVHISKVRFFNYDDLKATGSGLTYAYFGDDIRLRNVQSANFSIGSANDGFYIGYNFTTFSAVFGIGQPLLESMSVEVITAISVGVGVPVILIIVGVTIVIFRMLRKRNGAAAKETPLLVNDSITTQ